MQVEEKHVPEAEKGAPFAAELGPRKVTFHAKGKKSLVQLVTFVKSATPQHLTVPPLEDEPPPPPPPVAGIGAGAVTGAMTLSNACSTSGWGESSKCPTDPAARKATKDDGRTTGRIADVSFAVGGAALVAAVVVWLVAPPRAAPTSSAAATRRLTLAPGPAGGWATVQF
jgi:hypothetical protein